MLKIEYVRCIADIIKTERKRGTYYTNTVFIRLTMVIFVKKPNSHTKIFKIPENFKSYSYILHFNNNLKYIGV